MGVIKLLTWIESPAPCMYMYRYTLSTNPPRATSVRLYSWNVVPGDRSQVLLKVRSDWAVWPMQVHSESVWNAKEANNPINTSIVLLHRSIVFCIDRLFFCTDRSVFASIYRSFPPIDWWKKTDKKDRWKDRLKDRLKKTDAHTSMRIRLTHSPPAVYTRVCRPTAFLFLPEGHGSANHVAWMASCPFFRSSGQP